ncbi:MAG: lytic transglycosylase domain-containing protein [Faecalibacterium sp.]|nr:lytic transglycosylase domain-containing protein [Faecalibacterium sp.]
MPSARKSNKKRYKQFGRKTRRERQRRRLLMLIVAAIFLVILGSAVKQQVQQLLYPRKYQWEIETWANEYGVDPLLIEAFVETESGFDPNAQSEVGARGLMQITEETFEWIKSKIAPQEPLTFDDLYDPEVNIRFGAYYVAECMKRYSGDVSTTAAAYHSGWGTVDRLLKKADFSTDGRVLQEFPYTQMANYVYKINRSYKTYLQLYGPEAQ